MMTVKISVWTDVKSPIEVTVRPDDFEQLYDLYYFMREIQQIIQTDFYWTLTATISNR